MGKSIGRRICNFKFINNKLIIEWIKKNMLINDVFCPILKIKCNNVIISIEQKLIKKHASLCNYNPAPSKVLHDNRRKI